MNHILKLNSRYGVWLFGCGSLLFFICYFFKESIAGMSIMILGAFIFALDPLFTLFYRRKKGQTTRSYLFVYSIALLALGSFLARQWIDVPVTAFVAGEDAFLPRLRFLLLFVFVLAYLAALVSRLMIHLSESGNQEEQINNARRSYHLRTALFSIMAFLTLLIGLNYFTTLRNPVIDFQGNLSFGDAASTIIASIENEITVYVFLPEAQNVKTRGKSGTNELYRISEDIRVIVEQLPVINSKITLKFLNADLASYESNEFGSVNNGTIIVRKYREQTTSASEKPYIERRVYIYTKKDMKKIEKEITRALVYVSAKKINVYFAASNGEKYESSNPQDDPGSIEEFKNHLRFFNATLRKLDHNSKWPGPIPDDCDILFLMGPTVSYGAEAKAAINDYILKGGRLFVAIDPVGKENMEWLMNTFGGNHYKYVPDILFNTRLNGVALTDSTGSHRITDSFTGTSRPPLVLLKNGYFELTKAVPSTPSSDKKQESKKESRPAKPEELMPNEIVFSMHNSHVDKNKNSLPDKNEQIGRKPVAIAFEQAGNDASAKIVVFSGVDFLSNQAMNFPISSSNLQIASDSVHWMTENPLISGLVPEESESKTIQLTDEIKFRMLILGVIVFPLLMSGGLALLIAIYRKKRRFIEVS